MFSDSLCDVAPGSPFFFVCTCNIGSKGHAKKKKKKKGCLMIISSASCRGSYDTSWFCLNAETSMIWNLEIMIACNNYIRPSCMFLGREHVRRSYIRSLATSWVFGCFGFAQRRKQAHLFISVVDQLSWAFLLSHLPLYRSLQLLVFILQPVT